MKDEKKRMGKQYTSFSIGWFNKTPFLKSTMKLFEFDPESYSKVTYNIGGIATHVYNSDKLASYVEQFNKVDHPVDVIPINVVYLIHHREGNYKYTEAVAYNYLKQYYEKKSNVETPLICITFDIPNHGQRLIDNENNQGWNENNQNHAIDMMSIIDSTIQNIKLIMDFLPSYLNLDYYLTPEFRAINQSTEIKFNNILCGYSLGGHVVIRYAMQYPQLVQAIHPVVGCSDLTSLFITRLRSIKDNDKKFFYFNYDELDLSNDEKLKYPESLHKKISKQDQAIFENFPMNKIKMFACFGKDDTLVPQNLSSVWCDLYLNTNDSTGVYIAEGVGHDVTDKMIDNFTTWLAKNV